MKKLIKQIPLRYWMLSILSVLFFALGYAQDSGAVTSTTTTTTKSTTTQQDWYAQPWVWIVGGAVFILLLIALIRGSSSSRTSRSDKVTITKRTE